jgi:hypothetical protein
MTSAIPPAAVEAARKKRDEIRMAWVANSGDRRPYEAVVYQSMPDILAAALPHIAAPRVLTEELRARLAERARDCYMRTGNTSEQPRRAWYSVVDTIAAGLPRAEPVVTDEMVRMLAEASIAVLRYHMPREDGLSADEAEDWRQFASATAALEAALGVGPAERQRRPAFDETSTYSSANHDPVPQNRAYPPQWTPLTIVAHETATAMRKARNGEGSEWASWYAIARLADAIFEKERAASGLAALADAAADACADGQVTITNTWFALSAFLRAFAERERGRG